MAGFSLASAQVVCLPCEFVDRYMPVADATFVKVYIYGFRQCFCKNPKCTVSDTAIALDILESDVVRSWKYWESQGVVRLIYNSENPADFNVEFADLSHAVIPAEEGAKNIKPTYSMADIAKGQKANCALKEMYTHAEALLGKALSQNDILTLYGFYDWLGLPVEVILMIVEHCASLGKKSMRYMEAVAISWSELGLCSVEKASNHLQAIEKVGRAKRKFKRLLNMSGRDLSDAEYAHLVEWSENLGFSDQMIKLAYEKTVLKTGKVSFQYMNAILKDWAEKGIKEPAQAETEQKKTASAQVMTSRTKFNSYDQNGRYDLDAIEKMALKNLAENK